MLPGFSSNLVSERFLEDQLSASSPDPAAAHPLGGDGGRSSPQSAWWELRRWWRSHKQRFGPASALRALHASAASLLGCLGYRPIPGVAVGEAAVAGQFIPPVALLTCPWHEGLDARWREAVRSAAACGVGWCFAFNGRDLRLIDARRTHARRFLQFDLSLALHDERSAAALEIVAHAAALVPGPDGRSRLDALVERSAREALVVCRNLRAGVLDALAHLLEGVLGARPAARGRAHGGTPIQTELRLLHAQALTSIYRILFLLFAEGHRLVPTWHPVYRESYTLDALCTHMAESGKHAAVWESLQAIWRLAHAGCHADDLRVTPFNGRLFAPAGTPALNNCRMEEGPAARALVALMTTRTARGRVRVDYRDLGVEQLGGIYETVLDFEPEVDARGRTAVRLRPGRRERKAMGTFYTPRALTDFLVRRTLHPLVDGADPAAILRLRVLDPAMGSGAFLVSACRYLAHAYEAALIRTGQCAAAELGDRERAAFRRTIAQRCLFGVDLNPDAVELARLSLWLTTLAADRPLTFLDHRLVCGDSLIGASPEDVTRQPPPGPRSRHAAPAVLPLFDHLELEHHARAVVPIRLRLADEPDDDVAVVREKDRLLAGLRDARGPWARWVALADLWCGCWFWRGDLPRPDRAAFLELAARIGGSGRRGPSMLERLGSHAERLAAARRFCHWPLQFPEVFYEVDGSKRPDAGFDAILGNPPWKMVRAAEAGRAPGEDRDEIRNLVRFVRSAGVYHAHRRGQPNQYQLFVERAVQLLRPGGRLGMVLPWGLAADAGSAPLRDLLFRRAATDTMVAFENAAGIFPIHRSVRFLVLTATAKTSGTARLACRLGERDPDWLDEVPDEGTRDSPPALAAGQSSAASFGEPRHSASRGARRTGARGEWLELSTALLERLSGPDLSVPFLRTRRDLELVDRLAGFVPLADPAGWGARFGRELNAADDREYFVTRNLKREPQGPDREHARLPVLDGRHIEPFRVSIAASELAIGAADAEHLVDPARTFLRPRLAYRDVASPTNQLTLIAARVPSGVLTTHTVFCLKTPLGRDEQDCLCGLLNSYVANYLVRQRVGTHVTVAIVERLPVPRPDRDSGAFRALAHLARRLSARAVGSMLFRQEDYVRLQAVAARLYGLTRDEYAHVLATFPLVPREARERALAAFA